MRAWIHGLGVATAPGIDPDPRVNRLPRLERMTFAAVREALEGGPVPKSLALVFGTGHGGLGATEAFLRSIASRGMGYGSATAFHQSVHHSPAGQLSIVLGIHGPSLTVSQGNISGEAALRVGITLLERFEYVLVVAADETIPFLEAAHRAFGTQCELGEGAGAVLLGRRPIAVDFARCELLSHPVSARRFAPVSRFGPPLSAALVASGARAISLAAPEPEIERMERARIGPKIQVLDTPASRVGFHSSGGLIRIVLAARQLLQEDGRSTCLVHGLARGGAQAITVLRRDA